MGSVIVDVADIKFSSNPNETIKAPSLGCCVGMSLFDPLAKKGGLVIFILPDSCDADTIDVNEYPYMFADLAIPNFLQAAVEQGLRPETSKIVVAGGGQLSGHHGDFNLGAVNSQAAIDVLSHFGLEPSHISLGGSVNRSLSLDLRTGVSHIFIGSEEIETV